MAIAYRSSSSGNTGNTPSTTLVVNIPTGMVAGDVLVAGVGASNGSTVTILAPSGGSTWKGLINISGSSNMGLSIYYHTVTGYEPASYTFNFGASCQASVVLIAYSGAYNFAPRSLASSSTGTLSTTSVTTFAAASYTTGAIVQFIGAMNTTASSTMTPGGSFNQRADTCTTSSQFVEVCGQDLAYTGLLSGGSSNAATISQSATSTALSVFLEAPRPTFNGLAQDESYATTWGSAITTFTSPAFQPFVTNYFNELVLVFVTIRNGSTTMSSITGGGLTWVNIGRANTNAGGVEVWRAFAPTPTSFTITGNLSASTTAGDYAIVGIVGADMTGTNGSGAIGAVTTGVSTSAAPTISVTTTRNNSWVWGLSNDASTATSYNTGGANSLIRAVRDVTNSGSSGIAQQASLTPASGTNVTINFTAPASDSCNIMAFEILPAIKHSLGAIGAG